MAARSTRGWKKNYKLSGSNAPGGRWRYATTQIPGMSLAPPFSRRTLRRLTKTTASSALRTCLPWPRLGSTPRRPCRSPWLRASWLCWRLLWRASVLQRWSNSAKESLEGRGWLWSTSAAGKWPWFLGKTGGHLIVWTKFNQLPPNVAFPAETLRSYTPVSKLSQKWSLAPEKCSTSGSQSLDIIQW